MESNVESRHMARSPARKRRTRMPFSWSKASLRRSLMFVKVAHQRAVGEVELLLLTQPAAKLGDRPVGLLSQRGISHDRQDVACHLMCGSFAGPASLRPVDEPVDALRVETLDPEAKGPFVHPAVAQNHLAGRAESQEMNRIETPEHLAVRPAIHRLLQLFERAGFWIG